MQKHEWTIFRTTSKSSWSCNLHKSFRKSWMKEKELKEMNRKSSSQKKGRLAVTNLLKIHSTQKFIIFVDELLNELTWAWEMIAKSRDANSLFPSFNSRFLTNVQTSDVEVKIITFHNSIKVEHTFLFSSELNERFDALVPLSGWNKKKKTT